MLLPDPRFGAVTRLAAATLVALAIASPASAQFGGIKKRLKQAAGADTATAATQAGTPAEPAGAGDGGMVVLTEEVVDRLIAGLKAGQAEREKGKKEDTPYGRHHQAQAAYEAATAKCQASQQTFVNRMTTDQKLADKYSAMMEKMSTAQSKGDQKLAAAYGDSLTAMQDPSCLVKQPTQPDGYYEAQRDLETRAENQEIKVSGLSRGDLSMAKERAIAILFDSNVPGGASPTEKAAVSARAGELKPLLGFQEAPAAAAAPAAPAPPPAQAAAPAAPTSPAASSMNDCMVKNVKAREAEIDALAKRAQAAQEAGQMDRMMAIADTIHRLQTAGCAGAR